MKVWTWILNLKWVTVRVEISTSGIVGVRWGGGRKRLNKFIWRASSVVDCQLDSIEEEVGERKMLAKLTSIMDNPSHPLRHTVGSRAAPSAADWYTQRYTVATAHRSFQLLAMYTSDNFHLRCNYFMSLIYCSVQYSFHFISCAILSVFYILSTY